MTHPLTNVLFWPMETGAKFVIAELAMPKELKKVCKMYGNPYETSALYIHQTNGLMGSYDRIKLYGARFPLNSSALRCAFGRMALDTLLSREISSQQGMIT